jgi:hypothetical protein
MFLHIFDISHHPPVGIRAKKGFSRAEALERGLGQGPNAVRKKRGKKIFLEERLRNRLPVFHFSRYARPYLESQDKKAQNKGLGESFLRARWFCVPLFVLLHTFQSVSIRIIPNARGRSSAQGTCEE